MNEILSFFYYSYLNVFAVYAPIEKKNQVLEYVNVN